MSAIPAEQRSEEGAPALAGAPERDGRPRPDGSPWPWRVIAGLLVLSAAHYEAVHFGEPLDPGPFFFRVILALEILALMIAGKLLVRRFGTPTAGAARMLRVSVPVGMLILTLLNWQFYVVFANVPHYILPSPIRIAEALYSDWPILSAALFVTLGTTFIALAIALAGGVALAVVMAQSRWVELALYPYAVILQVTPIVAIAPLIIIYVPTTQSAVLICAWIVAFFPVLSNTTQGLHSTDHNLLNLFELYGASPWQTLIRLKLPSALPYFLAGLRIAGGLALIAAVVGEFAAGTAGAGSGLAFRLIEAQYRLNIPRLFAALVLLSFTGILIFFATSLISHLFLRRWHESAVRREN